MEYYLCRAMEVARLTNEELIQLHKHEKKASMVRGFLPDEIEKAVSPKNLPGVGLKEYWGIPDNDQALAFHRQRLKDDLVKIGVLQPRHFLLTPLSNITDIHNFDWIIKNIPVDFKFSTGDRKSAKDKIKEDD